MCAIWGIVDYKGSLTHEQKMLLLTELSLEAQSRGTDATGIAWVQNRKIQIQKAPRPACRMRYRVPEDVRVITGHTRMVTQGIACRNQNNHPFPGRTPKGGFALAHNGVIANDRKLKKKHRLPRVSVETDSYVAVQLLERAGEVSMQSLTQMAEQLEGSFTFSVLDSGNNLYLVKGNNPLRVYHFTENGFYLYASTQMILDSALKKLGIQYSRQDIAMQQGDILRIDRYGNRAMARFDDSKNYDYRSAALYDAYTWQLQRPVNSYLEDVFRYGEFMGIPRGELEILYEAGYGVFELEELIHDKHYRQYCLADVLYSR